MLKISIVKVENPSCLWGRIICGSGGDSEMTEQYDRLMVQMNLFYRDDTQDLRNLKPSSLEEGQVCVVYCAVMKSWYRAVVESVIVDSVSHKARCLLVDHGERVVVSSDQIRVAVPNFLRLPFWVKRFQLAGIKPTKLRVFVYKESAELIPSTQWDSSATLYLQNLLQESTWTEAVLRESQPDSTSIELYLTINKIKICVNDDLVAKKFAYYSRKPDENCGMDVEDRLPVMLSSGVLTHTMSSVSKKPAAQTQPPPMTTHGAVGGRAGDWLVASSMPQGLTGGPIISDVTDISQASMALQMQPDETREKCMMLIKEEPVSPGVRGGGGKGGSVGGGEAVALTSSCEVCSSEPPVLPVAMVQSVLEGRSSAGSVVERRSKRPALDRVEVSDKVENVDMSLEENIQT